MAKETKVMIETDLIDNAKQQFPSAKGMTYAGFIDWLLREIALGKVKEASS